MKTPTNVHVDGLSAFHNRAAASWNLDGARYHVWFDLETKQVEAGYVLYKNPPLDVSSRDPGFFNTRKLDADSPSNAKVIERVFAEIEERGLIAAAIEENKREEYRRGKEMEALALEQRIKESGPELLAALERVADDLRRWREEATGKINESIRLQVQTYEDQARATIANVKGGRS